MIKDIKIFLTVFAVIVLITLAGYIGYWLGSTQFLVQHNFIRPTITVLPSISVAPTTPPVTSILPSTSINPTATATITPTATPLSTKITNILADAEEVTTGLVGGKTYGRQFVYTVTGESRSNHFLLEASKVPQFPILSSITSPYGSFRISSDTVWIGAAAGNAYIELTNNTTILVNTKFEGESTNAYGDGKTYFTLSVCSTKYSQCVRYLVDKTVATGGNLTLLQSAKQNDTIYLSGAVKSAGAAAGTSYYYVTGNLVVQK